MGGARHMFGPHLLLHTILCLRIRHCELLWENRGPVFDLLCLLPGQHFDPSHVDVRDYSQLHESFRDHFRRLNVDALARDHPALQLRARA